MNRSRQRCCHGVRRHQGVRSVVQLAGCATFAAKGRPARKGRHPRTGASIAVPASKSVRYRNRPVHERTLRRRCRGAWAVHREDGTPHGESQGDDGQAVAQNRVPVDGKPVLGPRLGSSRGRHHSEHDRDDIHRDGPSAIRADHVPGVARPDPQRACPAWS